MNLYYIRKDVQPCKHHKQEAANCLGAAVKSVGKALEEGESTAASAHTAAAALGERGGAFAYIAKVISESVDALKGVAEDFENAQNLSAVISQIQQAAFGMNISAFNAAVESARAGNPEGCAAAADKIRGCAWAFQEAARECGVLCDEYRRLIELTRLDGRQSEQALAEKRIEDLIFQSGILYGQFALEAERVNRGPFRALAQAAGGAHAHFARTRDAARCRASVEAFLQDLKREASALEIGGSFASFAREYELFLSRI